MTQLFLQAVNQVHIKNPLIWKFFKITFLIIAFIAGVFTPINTTDLFILIMIVSPLLNIVLCIIGFCIYHFFFRDGKGKQISSFIKFIAFLFLIYVIGIGTNLFHSKDFFYTMEFGLFHGYVYLCIFYTVYLVTKASRYRFKDGIIRGIFLLITFSFLPFILLIYLNILWAFSSSSLNCNVNSWEYSDLGRNYFKDKRNKLYYCVCHPGSIVTPEYPEMSKIGNFDYKTFEVYTNEVHTENYPYRLSIAKDKNFVYVGDSVYGYNRDTQISDPITLKILGDYQIKDKTIFIKIENFLTE